MNDLFILGAGASVPYGFPCGESLFKEIREKNYREEYFKDESCKNDYFKYFGKTSRHYDIETVMKSMYDFTVDIKKSSMVSIDDFLRNRKNLDPNQLDFGKRIIAYKILEAEYKYRNGKYEKGKEYKNKIDWINYLLSFIDRSKNLEKAFFNSKFIIFNYDRLFEQKIFEYLNHDKNLSNDEEYVWGKLEKMEIFHIHGYIGKLKDIKLGDIENKNYTSIANNMKTVWEKDNKNRTKIQHYFSECNRIFFLGFGWLEDNMNELGLNESKEKILRGKEIHGTAYKMSDYNIKNIENRLKLCGALQPNIKNCEAVDLIKDFFQ